MSGWTEYRAGDEWPEGENVKWQYMVGGKWWDTNTPRFDWEDGQRIRYRERELEMGKVFFHKAVITYHNCAQHIWIRLAAPIAAYSKDMRYMAMDKDGDIRFHKELPKPHTRQSSGREFWANENGVGGLLLFNVPKEAMPDDWKTAIVELVHEGGE
jgi:hypothetical protein